MGKHFGHVKELLRRAETEEPFDTFVAPTSAAPVEAEVTGHVVTPPPTAGSLPTIGTHWRAPSSTPQTSAPKRCPGPSLACGVTACCGSLQNRPGGSSRSTSPSPSSWRWVGLLPHQQFARVALTRLTPPPLPVPNLSGLVQDVDVDELKGLRVQVQFVGNVVEPLFNAMSQILPGLRVRVPLDGPASRHPDPRPVAHARPSGTESGAVQKATRPAQGGARRQRGRAGACRGAKAAGGDLGRVAAGTCAAAGLAAGAGASP